MSYIIKKVTSGLETEGDLTVRYLQGTLGDTPKVLYASKEIVTLLKYGIHHFMRTDLLWTAEQPPIFLVKNPETEKIAWGSSHDRWYMLDTLDLKLRFLLSSTHTSVLGALSATNADQDTIILTDALINFRDEVTWKDIEEFAEQNSTHLEQYRELGCPI